MTINKDREEPGSPEHFRKARFELGATLLQDGFWAPMGPDYGLRWSTTTRWTAPDWAAATSV